MSDSTPLIMMMMMGMVGSFCLSAVGGVGVWYIKDNTLGGLLPGDDTDPPSDESETPSDDDKTSSGIPLDTKVYIHGILEKCDGEHSYTLLYAKNDNGVDASCSRDDSNKDNYLWTIQSKKSGKWMYYTIKNVGQKKYLAPDGGAALKLSDSEYLWRIKEQKSKDGHYSISSKDAIDGKKMTLDFWQNNCKQKAESGKDRRINLYNGYDDFDDVKDNSQFMFRPAKNGWKGAVKNPC
jgi:hypothetical protein